MAHLPLEQHGESGPTGVELSGSSPRPTQKVFATCADDPVVIHRADCSQVRRWRSLPVGVVRVIPDGFVVDHPDHRAARDYAVEKAWKRRKGWGYCHVCLRGSWPSSEVIRRKCQVPSWHQRSYLTALAKQARSRVLLANAKDPNLSAREAAHAIAVLERRLGEPLRMLTGGTFQCPTERTLRIIKTTPRMTFLSGNCYLACETDAGTAVLFWGSDENQYNIETIEHSPSPVEVAVTCFVHVGQPQGAAWKQRDHLSVSATCTVKLRRWWWRADSTP